MWRACLLLLVATMLTSCATEPAGKDDGGRSFTGPTVGISGSGNPD